jgi:BirA family biotin operon repressor/biotin-[acetyl-CoA-carboxylase] ligase
VGPVSEDRGTDWAAARRPEARIGHAIEVHDTIGSTNDRARELLAEPGGEGVLVVAEGQSAGRGRRGRTWWSQPGRSLSVSVGLRPRLEASRAWQLGLAVALAAREACESVAPTGLKWPNDLVAADGRKVGGLLVETALEGDRLAAAVVGVGINANWRRAEMPVEISGTATSLGEVARRPVDRVGLLRALAEALEREVEAVERGRSPLEAYRTACVTLGSNVAVDTPAGRIEGPAVAVDEAGALVVETPSGPVAVTSGEVVRVRAAVPA